MSKYLIIKSQKDSDHTYFNGYLYRSDRNTYRCTIDDCTGRARMDENDNFYEVGKHTHKPNFKLVKAKIYMNYIVERAINFKMNREEAEELFDKYFEKIGNETKFNALWQRIYRRLRNKGTCMPTHANLLELENKLNNDIERVTNDENASIIQSSTDQMVIETIVQPVSIQNTPSAQIQSESAANDESLDAFIERFLNEIEQLPDF